MAFSIERLTEFVGEGAAIRRIARLQPVGGPGDKIFPPTYPGEKKKIDPPRHVTELRRVKGADVWCVLVDSVQSQANRLEEALLAAIDEGALALPRIVTRFPEDALIHPVGDISSLEAPHRVFDAIFRDSRIGKAAFMKTAQGETLQTATPAKATTLFELSPSALLFGAWNSTGSGGGLGAKFARCLVSEIVGINVPMHKWIDRYGNEHIIGPSGKRTGSRIDPVGVRKEVKIYHKAEDEDDWTPDPEEAAGGEKNPKPFSRRTESTAKKGTPATINHGNIPPIVDSLGVTADYLEHKAVITCAGLRRLGFPDGDGRTLERDNAARALLAALGLVAFLEQDAMGYALRSRCDLCREGPADFELVGVDGATESFALSRQEARALFEDAVAGAEAAGFSWNTDPLILNPQEKLIKIVRQSQENALASKMDDTVEKD